MTRGCGTAAVDTDGALRRIARELEQALAAIAAEPDLADNRLTAFVSTLRAELHEVAYQAEQAGYARGSKETWTELSVTDSLIEAHAAGTDTR